jgi:hypothetical protein
MTGEEHVNDDKYINYLHCYKVANGHVVQIKLVGYSTEVTFVVQKGEDLAEQLPKFINKVLQEKN